MVKHDGALTTALLTSEGTRRSFRMGDEAIALGYLAFVHPVAPSPQALVALLSFAASEYPLVAFGLDAEVAKERGLPAALESTTFAFGRASAQTERLGAHELLLI